MLPTMMIGDAEVPVQLSEMAREVWLQQQVPTFIPHLVDASMAEAYALKEELMLAQHTGRNRSIRLYRGH